MVLIAVSFYGHNVHNPSPTADPSLKKKLKIDKTRQVNKIVVRVGGKGRG